MFHLRRRAGEMSSKSKRPKKSGGRNERDEKPGRDAEMDVSRLPYLMELNPGTPGSHWNYI